MRNVLKNLVLLFIVALPFGTKKFIAVLLPKFFENAHEFSSFFIYATDVFAVALLILALFYFKKDFFKNNAVWGWVLLFFAFALVSTVFAIESWYVWYMVGELGIAILSALVIRQAIAREVVSFRDICVAFGLSAFFQAVIALTQFYFQKSIGLWFLGEPIADSATRGVARVSIEGINYLRSFGTLPHANILASFLVLGFIAIAYLYFTAPLERTSSRMIHIAGMVTILYGLIFTFSRSGWIIGALAIFALLAYGFIKREFRYATLGFLGIIFIFAITLVYNLGWVVMPRAGFTKGEASVDHRVFYNEIGVALIKSHPFGVGIGNQVVVADANGLYAQKGLPQIWLAQPVHNIYILIASELGIFGIVVFLILLFYAFRAVHLKYPKLIFASVMFGSLLAFGLVDHFPWDLHAGRLLFWVMFGIMVGLVAEYKHKPSSSNG